ncbi:MAG: hypothetical protein ACTTKJ_03600 [Prevotella koreensis]|uniref:hypothetical protein n=1 Tax=Prevotella koreensis TaxID=2490854 RepID=UPI003F9EC682
MKNNLGFKTLLLSLMVLFSVGGYAEEKTSTLTFNGKCNGSGTADDGVKWTITSDGSENEFHNAKGIQYGTANNPVSYLRLKTSGISGTITQVVVNASRSAKTTAKLNVTVNGMPFGAEESLTQSNKQYTFTGNSTGEIVVELKQKRTNKALYVKSIVVTYYTEVPQGTENPENNFANAVENATVGQSYTLQTLTTKSDGGRNYESSSMDVASIDKSGEITLHKAGETTITVKTLQTAIYAEGSASYKLIVSKGTPDLKFDPDNFFMLKGDENEGPKLINSGDGAVTYSIVGDGIAEIMNTGFIKALNVGTATVTATAAETDAYLSASASYTLTVEENLISKGRYEIVTDVGTLQAGDKLIFVYQGKNLPVAMGVKKTNNFGRTIVVYSKENDKSFVEVQDDDKENVTQILLGGKAGEWTFNTKDGYLCTLKGGNNYLRTTNKVDNYSKASISSDKKGVKVKFIGSRRIIKYNDKSYLFSAYWESSDFPLIQIYRKVNDITVSFDRTNDEITYGDNYNLQLASIEGSSDELVYTSSDETKVRFHGNNIIDILAPGTVTITAKIPHTIYSAEYELKINKPSDSHPVNLTFGETGYLTWVATDDIDFANTNGVKAYQIKEATKERIVAEEVNAVPKGAAVLLKGNGTVTLTHTTGVEPLTDNKMKACTDLTVVGMTEGQTSTDVYVLGKGSNGIGFYMLKNTLQVGKGYLIISGTVGGAKPGFVGFDETVNGIDGVAVDNYDENGAFYNLQGVRSKTPQKGIYIKNGKKVVFK